MVSNGEHEYQETRSREQDFTECFKDLRNQLRATRAMFAEDKSVALEHGLTCGRSYLALPRFRWTLPIENQLAA